MSTLAVSDKAAIQIPLKLILVPYPSHKGQSSIVHKSKRLLTFIRHNPRPSGEPNGGTFGDHGREQTPHHRAPITPVAYPMNGATCARTRRKQWFTNPFWLTNPITLVAWNNPPPFLALAGGVGLFTCDQHHRGGRKLSLRYNLVGKRRREDSTSINLKEMNCKMADWTELVQG
uniref:Uncharacterized protein n=1 Tax=Timema bartmani TaxID=61472 RepID=A0A7R9F3Y6_9NEOP|nr:unnamed protein product [Timema bartmani]